MESKDHHHPPHRSAKGTEPETILLHIAHSFVGQATAPAMLFLCPSSQNRCFWLRRIFVKNREKMPRSLCSQGGRGFVLVACLYLLAAGCGQCADNSKPSSKEAFLRSEFREYGLAEAQAEVEALKRLVAEQEAYVESIKSTLWQPALGTCGAQGQECARGDEAAEMEERDEGGGGKKERRRKAENSKKKKPLNQAEHFRAVARFRLPKGAKPTGLKWLPYPNSNSPVREMNRLLVASDSKGSLHFFDDAGRHISSHQTGGNSITSMSVGGKWDGELKVFTAGGGGEVRTFSVSPPPRHIAPPGVIEEHSRVIDERLAKGENSKPSGVKLQPDAAAKWEPMVLEVSRFHPTKVEMLPWDNSSKAMADLSGPPKPIKFVDYVQRGKISYNTIVGDSEGRVSVHIRNGTLLSSFQIPGGIPPPDHRGCVLSTGSWTAVCAKSGLAFYSVQPRHLHPARCYSIPATPPPENEAESAEGGEAGVDDERGGGGGGGKKARGGKKGEQIATEPVTSEIVSLASDVSSPSTVYAGTKDGRILVLQVKGDGTRLRCTVVNDMAVSLKPAPILVSSIKGFALATVAATGDSTLPPSLSVYNVSNGGASRRSPPNLLLHIPLEPQGGDKGAVLIHTDRRTGIAVLGPSGEGFIYKYSQPINPSSEMLFSVLNWVKSPAVVILVAGIVFWQVRSRMDASNAKERQLGKRGMVKPEDRWEHGRGMTDAYADMTGRLGMRDEDMTDDAVYGKMPPRYGGTDADVLRRYGKGLGDAAQLKRRDAEMYDRVDRELHSGADSGHYGAERGARGGSRW